MVAHVKLIRKLMVGKKIEKNKMTVIEKEIPLKNSNINLTEDFNHEL